jgi:hypothetical protein
LKKLRDFFFRITVEMGVLMVAIGVGVGVSLLFFIVFCKIKGKG